MFEAIVILMSFIFGLFLAIVISGIFLWIALIILGERRSLLASGIANIVSSIVAGISVVLLSIIPFLVILSPIIAFLVYSYVLSKMLDISYGKAIVAAILSFVVLVFVSYVVSLLTLPLNVFIPSHTYISHAYMRHWLLR